MRRFLLTIIFAGLFSSASAEIPAVKIGSGEYHKFLFYVYDATLSSNDGKFDWAKPFAIKLDYKMSIDGDDIAEKSLEEMQNISPVPKDKGDKWLADMKVIFPDVEKGDNIVGVNIPQKGAEFYKNGKNIGNIYEPEFARRFFEIWLNLKTSDKKLRSNLLGEK